MSTDTGILNLHPDRNLGMELVRATEAAAIRAYPFIGKGDKNAADGAALVGAESFDLADVELTPEGDGLALRLAVAPLGARAAGAAAVGGRPARRQAPAPVTKKSGA